MKIKNKMIRTTFSLNEDQLNKLRKKSQETGIPVSYMLREAVHTYLATHKVLKNVK